MTTSWLLPFAVFGITWVVRYTHGPFSIFLRIRKRAGIAYLPVYDSDGNTVDIVEEIPNGFWPNLFGCFWCLGTWVSLILVLLYFHSASPSLFTIIVFWFGQVGVAGFLHELVNKWHE